MPATHNVFQYFNGIKKVYGDPLEIEDELNYHLGGDINKCLEMATHEDVTVSKPAVRHLVEVTRIVFKMVPYNDNDGSGAKRVDCIQAFNDFTDYKIGLKKSIDEFTQASSDTEEPTH